MRVSARLPKITGSPGFTVRRFWWDAKYGTFTTYRKHATNFKTEAEARAAIAHRVDRLADVQLS